MQRSELIPILVLESHVMPMTLASVWSALVSSFEGCVLAHCDFYTTPRPRNTADRDCWMWVSGDGHGV
jgi:hypothetical protein